MSDKTDVTIEAKTRDKSGKTVSRQLRKAGRVPAVLNHKGKSTLLDLDPKMLSRAWRDGGKQFTMSLNGQTSKVRITDLQLDPVKRLALHVDLAPVE